MNSISSAMLWELMTRGRWQIPGWFLFGNFLPFLLYTAFHHFQVDFADPAMVAMHVVLLQLTMLIFGLGIVAAQGTLSRLFLLPISTQRIVAWHFLPGSLLLSLEVSVSLSVQNAHFGLNQPILGPALFAAAAWACAQRLVGQAHRTLRSVLLASVPCVLSFCWFGARYGGWFQQPVHYWRHVTPTEFCTILLGSAACYLLTIKAISRDRCGEHLAVLPIWRAIESGLEQFLAGLFHSKAQFGSATEAQLWFEWRSKGFALPTIVLFVALINAIVVAVRMLVTGNWTESLQDFQKVTLAGGFLLPVVGGLSGLLLGTTSSGVQSRDHSATIRDLNTSGPFDRMGSFPASRPITNRQYATVILQAAVRSVALSWGLWALVTIIAAIAGVLTDVPLLPQVSSPIRNWYVPGTLLAAWIGMTSVASAALTGRFAVFSMTFFTGILSLAICNLLLEHYASQQIHQLITATFSILIAFCVTTGTALTFLVALRRSVILPRHGLRCLGFSVALTLLALLLRPPGLAFAAYPWIPAFAALVILPIATTPLAIEWNRHR